MSWDLYKVASGLDQKDEKIQVATLLHVLGKECVEIFSNFVWDSEDDRDKIEAVEGKFKAHCAPLTSRHFNRYLFIERKQQDGETVDEFCSALKTLAKNSDLGDKEESWITSMLVLGLKDPFSKERLMEREQSLEKTLQAARIAETSKQHMKSIKEEGSKVEKVDVVDGKGQKPQWGMPCRSCGIRHARDSCPAAGRRCHKCQKMNHFSRMCRTPDGQKKQVNTLDDCDSDSEVMFIGAVNAGDKDWVETVNFGTVQEVFKLDTGAQCNVLPKAAYDKITTNPLQPSSARLESYSKTCIRPVGKCELPCWVCGERYQVCFQVVDGNYMPILGRSSCENMGLIQRINAIESVSILKKGMSKLKRNFWQLAVVFGCAKFAEYIVGRDVTVESDHKPLEAIMKKPLHVAPLRLQRMLVQLQRFPGINVVYKRGDSLHLADALSRAHLEEQLTNAEQLDINLVEDVISDHQLARFAEATKEDAILSDLQQVILSGWPDSKGQVPPNAQEFWNYRDELTVAQGLIVKGQKIVVPSSLRGEMLEKLHEGHLGINKTIARARDVLFWPRMSVEITEKIKNCPVCAYVSLCMDM